MKLIFFRHGLAKGQRDINPAIDFERELTTVGKKALQTTIKAFKKYQPSVDVIFTSPLIRAVQTSEMLWTQYKTSDLEIMSDLGNLEDPKNVVEYISFLPSDGYYVFVGHEPHLSQVISDLLRIHSTHDYLAFKKGGICVLEGGMWKGFKLELLLSPKLLREVI
jgi:phosphohistidine phosphatase